IVLLDNATREHIIAIARHGYTGNKPVRYFLCFIVLEILDNGPVNCAASTFVVGMEEYIIFIAFAQGEHPGLGAESWTDTGDSIPDVLGVDADHALYSLR